MNAELGRDSVSVSVHWGVTCDFTLTGMMWLPPLYFCLFFREDEFICWTREAGARTHIRWQYARSLSAPDEHCSKGGEPRVYGTTECFKSKKLGFLKVPNRRLWSFVGPCWFAQELSTVITKQCECTSDQCRCVCRTEDFSSGTRKCHHACVRNYPGIVSSKLVLCSHWWDLDIMCNFRSCRAGEVTRKRTLGALWRVLKNCGSSTQQGWLGLDLYLATPDMQNVMMAWNPKLGIILTIFSQGRFLK